MRSGAKLEAVPRVQPRRRFLLPGPVLLAGLYTALVALSLALYLLDTPIQLTDSFNHLLNVQGRPLSELLWSYVAQPGYFRPLWWAETKMVFDLSRGSYHEWFRGLHAAQTSLLVALAVWLMRPRTWSDLSVLPLALSVLVGLHTFAGLVREAFPVNHYQLATIACVGAALLARAPYRWWSDPAAALLFVLAAGTVESGLLVAVVVAGAYLVGERGISRRGAALVAGLFIGYFVLRLGYIGSGPPGLGERSSGFGFSVLDPPELTARFGDNAAPFYAYNVGATLLTVLFTEPRGGVFRYTHALLEGRPTLPMLAAAASSVLATATIAWFVWARRRAWRTGRLDADDRLVLLAAGVLAGSAVMSYAYTKDVIAATAGVFYACAVFVAVRHLAGLVGRSAGFRRTAGIALLALLSLGWAYRLAGSYAGLRSAAYANRVEWVDPGPWLADQGIVVTTPEALALLRVLRDRAVSGDPRVAPMAPRLQYLMDFD